jgi:hypothetical protein
MEHCYTFEKLSAIISYTPQLRRLNLMETLNKNPNIAMISPTVLLSYLAHLSINVYNLTFDTLEIFIRKMSSKLKVLRINRSHDITYLDAHRWEQLIFQYFPQLKTFFLQYYERIDEKHEHPIYLGGPNEFLSSF